MKEVKINGYAYWFETATGKLFLEDKKLNEVPQNFMTANEKKQLENFVKYGRNETD